MALSQKSTQIPLGKSLVFQAPIVSLLIIFYSFAILSTVFRLIYRSRARQLWWDDFWALIALLNLILLFGGYIRVVYNLPPPWLSSFTMVMVTSRLALWSSRLSVAVTVVRVIATGKSLIVSKVVATLFGLIGIGIIAQKAILCTPPGTDFKCRDKSIITAYTDLATSFFADFWLLGAPTYLLWRMKLKKQFYRLLQAIFATEILVLITSILHCIFIVKNDVQAQGVISHFKVVISLIVCNLLFLVTYVYRHLRNEEPEDETTTAPSRKSDFDTSSSMTRRMTSTGPLLHSQTLSCTTSIFLSSASASHQDSPALFESEPGIVTREWPSAGIARGISTV